jgi:hypothetical protein
MDRLVAVSVAVATGLAVVGFWSQRGQDKAEVADKSLGMTATSMQRLDEEEPAAPLVLPVELPKGYGWASLGTQEGDGQQVWARTVQFVSVNAEPVVEVCAKPSDQSRGCEQDDDPFIERSLDGLAVLISFAAVPDEAESAFWEHVELSRDYQKIDWLPAS